MHTILPSPFIRPVRVFAVWLFAVLVFCLLIARPGEAASAQPQVGQYKGVLKVTRTILGQTVTTTIKAVAEITAANELIIVVIVPPVLNPDHSRALLRTRILEDGTCIIPENWIIPQIGGDPDAVSPQAASAPAPEFKGFIRRVGGTFSITYDDVPERYVESDGSTAAVSWYLAPVPSMVGTFTFRKIVSR